MNQKGFINIILVIIIVILVGTVGYFTFVKKSEPITQQPTPTPTTTQTKTSTSPTPTPTQTVNANIYTNSIYGFQIDNPKHYIVNDGTNNNPTISTNTLQGLRMDNSKYSFCEGKNTLCVIYFYNKNNHSELFINISPANNRSLNDLVKLDNIVGNPSVQASYISIDSIPAVRAVMAGYFSTSSSPMQYHIVHKGFWFVFGKGDVSDINNDEFDTMMESLHFLK